MNRNCYLDLLRMAAVSLVMFHHLPHGMTEGVWWLGVLARGGYCGVDLFFVLSGFLISGLLMTEYDRHGRIAVGRFLMRRAFKLYPAFWVMIAATVAVRLLVSSDEVVREMWPRLAAELLFVQNYFPGLWSHTWTLGVEEHFYVGLSAIVALFACLHRRGDPFWFIPWLFAMLAIGCLLLRLRLPEPTEESDWFVFAGTHLRADSLMFGVLLRWFARNPVGARLIARVPASALVVAGVIVMATAFLAYGAVSRERMAWGPSILYLGAGCLVIASISVRVPSNPFVRACARGGAESYSIYLWHLFVFAMVIRLDGRLGGIPPSLSWLVYFLPALAVGVAMSRAIEQPVLKIRDRLFPSRSTSIADRHDAASPP